jgi:glycosyltransferase involved in cell wall biosynthesis
MIQPLFVRVRADVVYAILPPLPLGVSGWVLALRTRARLVVNVQDLYPDIAVATGFLKNRWAIQVFRRMERWIYRRAERVVVISEEFRRNLLAKGVPAAKIAVVPNWADPDEIVPMERENSFRQGVGVTRNEFLVLYSGGLTVNSFLEPVIDAARILQDEPFRFVVVGEGAQKAALSERASGLKNVTFLPFQPLERYNEVLAAADVTVVTLNSAATFCSVPSKIFKQMAAARPVLAVTTQTNELTRLVECSQSGFAVNTGKAADVAAALRKARAMGSGLDQLGRNGREYLIRECSRERCVGRIAEILAGAEGASETRH